MNLLTEALVERIDEGGWIVRSPRVGVYRGCPRAGGRRSAGDAVGLLTVLNRSDELLLPAGVEGVVADIQVHDRAAPVEYGQKLFRLEPIVQVGAPGATGAVQRRTAAASDPAQASLSLPAGCLAVTCPIDGIFYRRPSPGAAPFVEAGAILETGRTLGLIEAMKSFNTVTYGGPGLPERAEILEARAADSSEVRQGVVLFVVREIRKC